MTSEADHSTGAALARCPACQQPLLSASERCGSCQCPLKHPNAATCLLSRPPLQWPMERHGPTGLLPNSRVILQLLPSGACLTLPNEDHVVLGRGPASKAQTLVDLDDFHAFRHGVSRRHCALLRQNNHLYIVDLGSSNGTSLNGERLEPHRLYTLADGDKLILGSMHFAISYFPPVAPTS